MVHTHTHTTKPVCGQKDVTMLQNQGVHTDTEITLKRPDIIIKTKKRENMHTDRCGNTHGQKCHANGSRKETEIQEFI
jgi:hypothetical protein